MVNSCANPKCAKPLLYLREGRIFVFEAEEMDGAKSVHRIKHFWLCGDCSQTLRLEKTRVGVRVVSKQGPRAQHALQKLTQPLAS
jgi:hypothetical protein